MTNPDNDYKYLATIVGKAKCFSGDAILEKHFAFPTMVAKYL
jgi:hypothetical protein